MCRSRAALESTWSTWAVHRRSDVRTSPRCLCILTFFRVLPLRLIAKSEEKGRLVNSIDTVLSTLPANFQSKSQADVASTDLCRVPEIFHDSTVKKRKGNVLVIEVLMGDFC